MDEPTAQRFTTRLEFAEHFSLCIGRSHQVLQLFDRDFAVFPLGATETDAALRSFLTGGGRIELAMHNTAYIEAHYPRFLRLLRDYNHRIECRVTSRSLQQLTDSFCIGDRVNIVRRFHSDHMRGEADFNAPKSTEISLERFSAIWVESVPGLHPTTTGL
jgi:hypothetical protein